MLSLLTQFGDSSSGLGALGLNVDSFIIQLITFVIALLVLKRWAFKPIMKLLDERKQAIAKGVELGEQMQKEKQELEAQIEKQLSEARIKADAIISGANENARDAIRKAESDALKRAESIVNSAKDQTKQDIAVAKKKLEGEIIDMVASATEVLTQEKVDAKKDAGLIHKALAGQVER